MRCRFNDDLKKVLKAVAKTGKKVLYIGTAGLADNLMELERPSLPAMGVVTAAENTEAGLYAIQYHPEVLHTAEGTKMLSNFVLGVCGCAGDWKMDAFVENTIREIREKVGDGRVLLALSGGVDSSVAAGLLSRAIGKQLTCVFVDHGLLRKDEGDEVEGVFGPNGQFDLNFIRVNAQQIGRAHV